MPTPNPAAISTKKVMRHAYQNEYREHLDEDVVDTRQQEATEQTDEPVDAAPLTPEEITFKDRYSNLRRFHETTTRELKTQIAELSEKINQNNKAVVLPKSPEAIEAWRKEYPEIFDIVRTVARTEAIDERADLDKKLKSLEDERRAVSRDRAMQQVLAVHPDFNDLRGTEDFHMWVQAQSAEIQSWLYDNEDDAQKAIYAVNLYKADRGIGKKPPKETKVDASRMVAPNSGIEPTIKSNKKEVKLSWVATLKPKEYEKHEDMIELARQEGRLIDDLR